MCLFDSIILQHDHGHYIKTLDPQSTMWYQGVHKNEIARRLLISVGGSEGTPCRIKDTKL